MYAFDDLRNGNQPFGKQSKLYKSHMCSYTRTTGIWQSVWLEFIPKHYISRYMITPTGDSSENGGYPIDFIKYFYNLNFAEAMEELLGNSHFNYKVNEERKKEFVVPQKNINNNRVFAYLTEHRGINPSVLNFFIEKNLIYESKEYGNAVFVGMDNGGRISHIHKRSVNSYGKRFVQNIEDSNPKHSFNYFGGSDRLYVFESPIDL